ncbi:alcohol dehydrogenase YqhD (iron-dependent ADH family) [Clostridium pascui]|uniref:iron-containing alcohol dehydrogenase n=1 Tax=Clostridium pascui TaxID=46609 RepID=UPI001957A3E6|nr:iron-containing alcohol dehydrogenase [Clostridium pascui]MBM7870786.1 alcohol dehydrogenase YqhD (iron-dependent ADH family) [Clostridium pascui]
MINFSYQNATKIIFGKNTEDEVGNEAKKYGNRILLHYGGGSIKKSGLYDRVVKSLKDAGVEIFELGGVKPNPRLSLVRAGIELCHKNNIDLILAVGGGSVIDSAKAIGIGACYDGDVWDFYTGKASVKSTISVGVILTIPAAGSESSTGSVITNEDGWYKRAVGSNLMRPVFAIMNPELTYTLPIYQTAAGAADMMAHIFERYFTNETHVDLTDRLSEGTLRTIIKNVPIVLHDPESYEARAEIMWAGTIAHNGILGTGRVEDWGTHDMEHEISGIYDVTHGAGLSILFPAWMKYVYKQDVNRFAQFANRVWDVEIDINNLEATALEGIERTKAYFKKIGMPVSLTEANVPSDRFEEMASKGTENGPLGNFVKLHKEDIVNIFNLAL